MVFIYVLKCQKDKYYVGKTKNPDYRLESHFREGGSSWTKKYKPIQLHHLIPDQTDHDEQRITQEYMEKYGVENVRGGPWCKIDISDSLSSIQHILKSSSDKCYTCGSPDHFTNKCPQKKEQKTSKLKVCKRCNRFGHTGDKCYATKYENGKPIEEYDIWCCEYCGKEFDSKKGCTFHENIHCPFKKQNKYFDGGRALQDELFESSEEEDIICFRCGREGHYAKTCYAKKHSKGYYLK
jgi:predicted GIY-YIG superfamily endonuclease